MSPFKRKKSMPVTTRKNKLDSSSLSTVQKRKSIEPAAKNMIKITKAKIKTAVKIKMTAKNLKTEKIPKNEKTPKTEDAPKTAKKPKSTLKKPDYFLLKSEPLDRFETVAGVTHNMKFGIDDLKTNKMDVPGPNFGKIGVAEWDGVRNYLARNHMRLMEEGDKALFYHSNAKPSGIVGIVEIVRSAYPDPHQFDKKDAHYAPKSKVEDPLWSCVDVKFLKKLDRIVSLEELKSHPELGKSMDLFTKARLSVCGVS
jgi:predicted RNA-binding protein with PUA-like domain